MMGTLMMGNLGFGLERTVVMRMYAGLVRTMVTLTCIGLGRTMVMLMCMGLIFMGRTETVPMLMMMTGTLGMGTVRTLLTLVTLTIYRIRMSWTARRCPQWNGDRWCLYRQSREAVLHNN